MGAARSGIVVLLLGLGLTFLRLGAALCLVVDALRMFLGLGFLFRLVVRFALLLQLGLGSVGVCVFFGHGRHSD